MSILSRALRYLLVLAPVLAVAQSPRQEILFNEGWKFNAGDIKDAHLPGYGDAAWRSLTLPHDWSIEMPFSDQWASATGFLPGGIGWYRKTFRAQPDWKGKQLFISFDGVYKNSEVWLNGHYLGKRPNGFVAFSYELTPYINFSGDNVLAVKADHTRFADSRWYTGSGIYRDVHLLVLNPVHFAQWGAAFSTPAVSASLAKAQVALSIQNAGEKEVEAQLLLKDPAGKQVLEKKQRVSLQANAVTETLLAFDVRQPRLWSVDNPALYTIEIRLLAKGKLVDEWKDQVGIRSFHFDAANGFSLNGQSLKMKGVCIHDDAGVLGVAVPEEVWVRRLALLKQAGCNAIRMSHNPHADYLYRLCDRMGLLVMDEAFDEWEIGKNKWIKGWNKGEPGKDGYHEYFSEWAAKDIEAMVLRNRNRPSVIMWSIGNEVDYPNDPYSHEVLNSGRNPQIYGRGYLPDHPPAAILGDLSERLVRIVKELDTTRPVTAALAGVVMSNTTSYPGNLDIVGYNYQEYRYDTDHITYPQRIIYGSENGMQYSAWQAVAQKPFISGQFLWTGIDYMGEAGQWPARSNGAGLITLGGFPKPEYYFRQSLWSDPAMLYIGTSPVRRGEENGNWSQKRAEPDWNKKAGDSVSVRCFTNCSEVELFLNGRSLGRQPVTAAREGVLGWNTVFEPGVLEAKGYRNGRQVCSQVLRTTGPAAAIKAEVYHHPLITKKDALQQVAVWITDKEGNELYRPGNVVTVRVEGAAELIGIENSNLSDITAYRAAAKPVVNGPLMVYLKPKDARRPFRVSFTAPGLAPVTLDFNK